MSEEKNLMPVFLKHGDQRQGTLFVDFKHLNNDRAFGNHGQSLKRLAERGGLAPCEIYANLEDELCDWIKYEDDTVLGWIEKEYPGIIESTN